MSYLVQHWAFDPFVVVAGIVVALHEVGFARLARRSDPRRTRTRRHRALFFYAGVLVLLVTVASPIDYWSERYFFVHMFEHIILMFAAPVLVVVGAPWVPLMHMLPVRARRKVGRFFALSHRAAPLRALWRLVTAKWTALFAIDAVMIFWHLPFAYDAGFRTGMVHIWLMHGSFFAAGVLFWLQIVPSRAFHRRPSTVWRAGAIVSTNVVMFVLAMALSILSSGSWYSVYAHVPGVTMSPFADQQLGAAILWVCGDFWALPALIVVLRELVDERGGFAQAFDDMMRRAVAAASRGASASAQPRPGRLTGVRMTARGATRENANVSARK